MTSSRLQFKTFCGGRKSYELIVKNEKIVIPTQLQTRVVNWYHQQLMHPGETRTEASLRQHYHWANMRQTVHDVCSKCPTCQKHKKHTKKYGHLPEKEAEAQPWDKLCVDLIGPYTFQKKYRKKDLSLWCVTMIDPATGWLEIKEIKNSKSAIDIANLVEQTWLTRYPWPTQINFDRGSEFMAEFARMIKDDYGVKQKATTTRNPQANAMIERAHQTIGNLIRTVSIEDVDETDLGQAS